MRKTIQEFRAFLLKQNALALAIGVVIGAAIGKVVSGLVEDVIMPVVGLVLPAGDWRNAQAGIIKYGDLIGRIVDFLIIAAVVFAVTKALIPAATRVCPECLEAVPLDARRCRACASPLSAPARGA